jgi:DNA-binding CsgD family transcriptional regulator
LHFNSYNESANHVTKAARAGARGSMSHSTRPNLSELRAVFRLLGDVRDLRHDRVARQAQMVNGLCKLLGARQGSVLEIDGFVPGGSLKLLDIHHGGWANATAAAIWEGLLRAGNFQSDLVMMQATRVPGNVVAVLRDQLVPDEMFYASPLFQELRPMVEIDSHVVGWCRPSAARPDRVLGLTFHRDWRAKPFNRRQREMLRIFVDEVFRLQREGLLDPPAAPGPRLTARESEVLQRLLKGDSIKETATRLGLSTHTVHDYVKNLHRKFDVSSRAELLARFVKPP